MDLITEVGENILEQTADTDNFRKLHNFIAMQPLKLREDNTYDDILVTVI